ncbi:MULTISPECIES: SNF2-related protein [Thermoanaerobacterium]|uniref:SNF2-related protein n=2 Tax=Thermoanaerobacterium TaxID=28895 RepID=W9ECD3_9THEO|nr:MULTISPECIES: SNF2-related protein [Thermoanaerobacterium]AFK85221.1 SNF2-related protein [Thermoanaerobacterium saccharolyticum JW/SL-YS485]ETO39793.1 SNF2-related protein [Thermoanaerobacterium aotearoense SCUT27]
MFTTTSKTLPDSRVIVTNYESVMIKLDWFKDVDWEVVVCDEDAYIKNRKAARSKAIATITKDVPHVWLLTATPMITIHLKYGFCFMYFIQKSLPHSGSSVSSIAICKMDILVTKAQNE